MPRDHRLYLDDILGAIERIQNYMEGLDYSRIAADQRTMDAVVRNLEIIGEAARSLPADIKDAISQTDCLSNLRRLGPAGAVWQARG